MLSETRSDGRLTHSGEAARERSQETVTQGVEVRLRRRGDYLDAFEGYERDEREMAPKTVESYLKSLKVGARWVGKEPWDVTSQDLRRMKREASFTRSTKSHVITSYKQLDRFLVLEGLRESNGIQAIPLPRISHVSKPPVTMEAARLLIGDCRSPNEFRLVYLGLFAGCRIAESAAMRDHHWRGDRLTFVGKGRKERTVPVHPELQKHRDLILSLSPKSSGVLQAVMKRMRERTGAVDTRGNPATSHSLRKRFATSVYNEGQVPDAVISRLLGHKRELLDIYREIDFRQMREAVLPLEYFPPEPVQLALFH